MLYVRDPGKRNGQQRKIRMTYLITFLEGIMSFISPCMLPLLPVYLSYFAAGTESERKRTGRIFCFVAGFTVSFIILGLLFSALGKLVSRHQTAVNVVCGILMIIFGLHYLEIIRLPFFQRNSTARPVYNYLSAFVFGLIYPVNLTPCIGAFLGSALALAATTGSVLKGASLLFVYSLGMGLPFVLSAILVSRMDILFNKIKAHYNVINRVCGIFLIIVGILIACGVFSRLIAGLI